MQVPKQWIMAEMVIRAALDGTKVIIVDFSEASDEVLP